MKKLFYGLGAIAAVATPVVAVVSCGSSSSEETTKFEWTKVEKSTAATLTTQANAKIDPLVTLEVTNKIIAKLGTSATSVELAQFNGVITGEEAKWNTGHSATDHIILVKGTPATLAAGITAYPKNPTATEATPADANKLFNVEGSYGPDATGAPAGARWSLKHNWGIGKDVFAQAQYMFFVQNGVLEPHLYKIYDLGNGEYGFTTINPEAF